MDIPKVDIPNLSNVSKVGEFRFEEGSLEGFHELKNVLQADDVVESSLGNEDSVLLGDLNAQGMQMIHVHDEPG